MSVDDEHSAACAREMRARGQYAADCKPCEAWARDVQAFIDTDPPPPTGPIAETPVERLIALPAAEVAALRAKAAAADRVRAVVRRLDSLAVSSGQAGQVAYPQASAMVRAELDGEGP